jgi:hypothetical protein
MARKMESIVCRWSKVCQHGQRSVVSALTECTLVIESEDQCGQPCVVETGQMLHFVYQHEASTGFNYALNLSLALHVQRMLRMTTLLRTDSGGAALGKEMFPKAIVVRFHCLLTNNDYIILPISAFCFLAKRK